MNKLSSLGDIQQVYTLLQQIEEILGKIDTKTDTARKKLNDTAVDVVVVNQMLTRTLSLLSELTEDRQITTFITLVQRAIALVNTLRIASALLETTSGPAGWALATVTILSVVISTTDIAGSFG